MADKPEKTAAPALAKVDKTPAYQPLEIFAQGFAWETYNVVAPGSVTLADVIRPEAWAHVARTLRKNDAIVVKSESGLFTADLEVVRTYNGGAVVRVKHAYEAPAVDDAAVERAGFRVEWAGPTHKYRYIDKATGEVVRFGFDDKRGAIDALPEILAERKAA